MAQVGAIGGTFNLPQYTGKLVTADVEATPFLAMAGGLNGAKVVKNQDFPTANEYDFTALSVPTIDETDSLSAPTVITNTTAQTLQTTQIFQEQVQLSYVRMANAGRFWATEVSTLGYGTFDPNDANAVESALAFQQAMALKKVLRDYEYSMYQGVYAQAVAVTTDFQMRGLIACASSASNTVAAGGADLSKLLLDELFRTMYANGAMFAKPVIHVNAFQKQQISDIYGYAPTDWNIGGVSVEAINTDFGKMGILLTRYMDTDELLVTDMSVISPVVQEVPGKGHLFYEPLSKSGAGESGQIFGMLSVDHGPIWAHGSITGLSTS